MMQLSGRFLILICLAFGAICSLQSSSALAEDPPGITDVPPVRLQTWGCGWTACRNTPFENSGAVSGYASPPLAAAAAMLKALDFHRSNCSTYPCDIRIKGPYEELLVATPGEESRVKEVPAATSADDWVVLYQCTSKNGGCLFIEMPGQTYCEAYSRARDFVCTFINDPAYGGACSCCYRIVKRPCCCRCVRRCR